MVVTPFRPDLNNLKNFAGMVAARLLGGVLARLTRLQNTRFHLVCGRSDGFGAQLHAHLSVKVCADAFGLNYAYLKPTNVIGADADMESLLVTFLKSLGPEHSGECPNLSVTGKTLPVGLLKALILRSFGRRVCLVVSHGHLFANYHPQDLAHLAQACLLPILAETVAERQRMLPMTGVFAHVRRGLMNNFEFSQRKESGRFWSELERAASDGQVRPITIASSEMIEIPLSLQGKVVLRIGEPIIEDMWIASQSKVLMLARSSLSYVYGLMNTNGTVIYQKFWHPPLASWTNLERD